MHSAETLEVGGCTELPHTIARSYHIHANVITSLSIILWVSWIKLSLHHPTQDKSLIYCFATKRTGGVTVGFKPLTLQFADHGFKFHCILYETTLRNQL